MTCVAARGCRSVVFKIRRGLERFASHPITPQMCSNHQAREPRASCTLPPSRAVSAGLMSTGRSVKNKGGSPGSSSINSAPEPAAAGAGAKASALAAPLAAATSASKKVAAAATTAAEVAAIYCKAIMATLPTAGSPLVAATQRIHTAARQEVAVEVAAQGLLQARLCLPHPLREAAVTTAGQPARWPWGGGRGPAVHLSAAQWQCLQELGFGIAAVLTFALIAAATQRPSYCQEQMLPL
jgi:hypothetical protein